MQDNILQSTKQFFSKTCDISYRFPVAFSRLMSLLDTDSFFQELFSEVSLRPTKECESYANVLVALGMLDSRLCMFIVNEPSTLAGAMTEGAILKIRRAQDLAITQRMPIIYLVESAGLDLRQQAGGFVSVGHIFSNMARLSKQRIPQVSVCYGTATAGGAYLVGLADFTILLAKQAQVFLAGPNLVSYAIGERNTPESLGGTELHQKSGLADVVLEDARLIPKVLKNWLVYEKRWPQFVNYRDQTILSACGDPEDLLASISSDFRRMFSMPEVVSLLLDVDYHEYKPAADSKILCLFAAIQGKPLGVIANKAPIDTKAAYKAVQFIERCESSGIPLLFLMHTTGFQVGREAEASGIINAGSRMIQAVTNCEVPKITLQIGGAFGAGYYAMCGRPFGADVVFSWPTAKLAVMGPEAGAQLLTSLKVQSAQKRGKPLSSQEKKALYQQVLKEFSEKMDVSYTSAQLWDDGVISPLDTRDTLAYWLDIFTNRQSIQDGGQGFGLSRIH